MEFNIGDRIKVKAYEDLPEMIRSKAIARMCNKVGTVVDKLFSEGVGEFLYSIKFDDFEKSIKLWTMDYLEAFKEDVRYDYEFDYLDNVVVARLYEIRGEEKTEIGRGHGHIIHEGAIGVSQAASYALKRIFQDLNGGSLTKYD